MTLATNPSLDSVSAAGKRPSHHTVSDGSLANDTLTPFDPWQFGYLSPFDGVTSLGLQPLAYESPDPGILVAAGAAASLGTTSTGLTMVLYLQEPGEASAISAYDINQGQMGDCYLLSSIGELALFHPTWITRMIQSNANGTETVTLYDAANGSLPNIGATAYKPVAINVTNSFPGNAVNSGASQDVYNGQKEIWVQVLEKAVATLYGGYNGIANGGIPSIAMEELTGCTATSVSPASVSLQQLQSAISAGDLITFDTGGSGNLPYAMFGDHAYMFNSLSTVNGTVMVNLLNPWGFDEPTAIPFSQIGSVIDQIDIDQFHQTTNQGPSLAQQTPDQTWAQGSHVSLTLPAGVFSESGQTLAYTATQANGQACPSWLTFNASTMAFSGTVPSGMETLSLKVTATDTSGLSSSETFNVTVPGLPPTLAHQTAAQTWTEGARLSFTLPSNTFADPNGEALSYSATLSNGQPLPSWLMLNSSSGTFTGTVGDTSGPETIKVTATDTSGLSVSETFVATLVAPAPTVTDQTANQTWTAGLTLSFALASNTFSAVPGQTLKYSATLPTGLTINATTGAITGKVPVVLGVNTVTVTATETSGMSVSESFKATVVAQAPSVHQTQTQTWAAHQAVSLSVAAAFADPQGETLTYTAALANGQALPSGLTFNAATATFGGLAPVAIGTMGITVTAKDQSGLSASETFQCVVAAQAPRVNNSPTAQYWVANKAVSFALPASTFTDPQGETLTYTATQSNGSALPGGLTFNATTGAFGGTAPITPETLGLKVTATDASGLAVSEQFSVAIQAAAPAVAHQTANQVWNAGATMSFLVPSNTFADPQGAALSYTGFETSGANLSSWLHFAAGSAALTGTVPSGLAGLFGVTIVATDAYGLSASETFGLTIGAAGAHLTAASAPAATEMLAMHG
jgi:hypothetical protein